MLVKLTKAQAVKRVIEAEKKLMQVYSQVGSLRGSITAKEQIAFEKMFTTIIRRIKGK